MHLDLTRVNKKSLTETLNKAYEKDNTLEYVLDSLIDGYDEYCFGHQLDFKEKIQFQVSYMSFDKVLELTEFLCKFINQHIDDKITEDWVYFNIIYSDSVDICKEVHKMHLLSILEHPIDISLISYKLIEQLKTIRQNAKNRRKELKEQEAELKDIGVKKISKKKYKNIIKRFDHWIAECEKEFKSKNYMDPISY